MTFDPAWESGYANKSVGLGRNSTIYQLMDSFCDGRQERVLELGCGVGYNIEYWLKRNADYYGLDGSQTAISACHHVWPFLRERIVCCDFTQGFPFTGFDVIFDRAAIAHNDLEGIRRTVKYIYDVLKPGGIFVSCDWFSDSHSDMARGDAVADGVSTRSGYMEGNFRNCGKVHYSSREEIVELFSDFAGVLLQERTIHQEQAGREFTWAVFDIVMRRAQ